MNFLNKRRIAMEKPSPVDLDHLEDELRGVSRQPWASPSPTREPMRGLDVATDYRSVPRDLDQLPPPDYAPKPAVTAEELGKITSEAIKLAYESTAASLQDLAKQMVARVADIEQLKVQAMKQVEEMEQLIAAHREAGESMAKNVQECSTDLSHANEMIQGMRLKLKGTGADNGT